MKEFQMDEFTKLATDLPLEIGGSIEAYGGKVTRIDAETLQLECSDTIIQLCRGKVRVLKGEVHFLTPGGDA